VVISDELCNQMIKPHNPEISMSKENVLRKPSKRVKPMLAMLIEKYQCQLEVDCRYRVTRGIKRDRFFKARNRSEIGAALYGSGTRGKVECLGNRSVRFG
jgi:hypothetical protein